MSTQLVAWMDDSTEPPRDVSREEFDQVREKQKKLIDRVKIVEAQVEALTAKVDECEEDADV